MTVSCAWMSCETEPDPDLRPQLATPQHHGAKIGWCMVTSLLHKNVEASGDIVKLINRVRNWLSPVRHSTIPHFRAYRLYPEVTSRGRALISMGADVYAELAAGKPVPVRHPAAWKNWNLARALLDLGFTVDAIPSRSDLRVDDKSFDVTIDVRANLEYLSTSLRHHGVRIYYPQFGHWTLHNGGQIDRHRNLLLRSGVSLLPARLLSPTLSVEHADHVLTPGGEFSTRGFAHVTGRLHSVEQSPPAALDRFLSRDMERARRHFVWIGGAGAVHKGLDLCLEVFDSLPDLHLHICGDLSGEPAFFSAFRERLENRSNIHYHGWTDTGSDRWAEIVSGCAYVLLHSASEVAATSPVAGMFTGLVPIVNVGADQRFRIDAPVLQTEDPVELATCVQEMSGLSPAVIQSSSRQAYERVAAGCTQRGFMLSLRKGLADALDLPGDQAWHLEDQPGKNPVRLPTIKNVTAEYLPAR